MIDCKSSADIRSFPLDSHTVVLFTSLGRTVRGNDGLVRFAPFAGSLTRNTIPELGSNPDVRVDAKRFPEEAAIDSVQQGDEWRTVRLEWGFGHHTSSASGVSYHDFVVMITRRREPGYYLTKALYPTAICGLLSTAGLIVPADELANRFGILLTLFLTVFAIQWITNDRLPKVSFLTRLDRQIVMTLVFIVFICLVSMGLAAALRLGADTRLIEELEVYAFGLFGVMWVLVFVKQGWAIYRHESSHEGSGGGAELSGFVKWWAGCRWVAEVEDDGKVGAAAVVTQKAGKDEIEWVTEYAGKEPVVTKTKTTVNPARADDG
eukprot:SAG31_NODE_5346_length_2594_cov_6.626052_2_plen_321_part_00